MTRCNFNIYELISRLPEAIAAYVFAQYFFLRLFIGWFMLQSGGYSGPSGILGDRGAGHARPPAGGCRANNVR